MKHTAFTIIELFVVIATIAVLLAILLPVLVTVRQQTEAIICGSNLRNLFLALNIYEQEKGTFPQGFDDSVIGVSQPPGGYVGNLAYDKIGWWWFHLASVLTQNSGKKNILRCPSKCVEDPGSKENILCGNYGVNRSICKDSPGITGIIGSEFVGKPLCLDRIRRPCRTLFLVDSGYSLISWRGVTDAPGPFFDNPMREGSFYVPGAEINKQRMLSGTISPNCKSDAINGRHSKKTVNVIFVDGHLTRLKADSLFVEEVNGKYYNQTPLWIPAK